MKSGVWLLECVEKEGSMLELSDAVFVTNLIDADQVERTDQACESKKQLIEWLGRPADALALNWIRRNWVH